MRHFLYLALLLACLLASLPLEFVLRTRVYVRWRQLLIAVVPVAVLFTGWDEAAIAAGWWHFDPRSTLGLDLPRGLPVEELLFFLVVPVCAVLTLEAVRARHPEWLTPHPGGPDVHRTRR